MAARPNPRDVNISSSSNSNSHSGSHSSAGTGTTKAERVMTTQFALQPCFENIARRPAFIPDPAQYNGNITELDVISNSFSVKLAENFSCDIIKYDVLFDPPLQEDAKMREEILMDLEADIKEETGDHALDNARIYCWQPLKEAREGKDWNPKEHTQIKYVGNASYEGTVTLKAGQRKDLSDLDNQFQSQICSVFLRQLCRKLDFTRMGRNHYDPKSENRQVDMSAVRNYSGSLLFMDGFRMSLEYTSYIDRVNQEIVPTISLTVDACSRVLEERTVQDVIDKITSDAQNKGLRKKEIIGEIKGRAVLTDYNNKIFKIDSVEFYTSPSKQKIWHAPNNEVPREITVKEYYKEQYNIDTDDYEECDILLCHDLSPRVRDAGKTRKLYIIPALCHLTGYPAKIRRNHMLMKKISRANKLPSKVRCEKVIKCAQRLSEAALGSDSPLLISPVIQPIRGRMIAPAPMFLQNKNATKKIEIANLQAQWKRFGMFDQKKLAENEWAVVFSRKVSKKIKKMVKGMKEQTKPMGAAVLGDPIEVEIKKDTNVKCWGDQIREVITKHKLTAVVAVIPCSKQPSFDEKQTADEIYSIVKRVCSKEEGIASQCIQSCNIDTSHVITGITRQLFTKLGSIPWKLKFSLLGKAINLTKPTMLVGIDVNHDRKASTSPVAFVSSWDRDFVRYHSQLRYHKLADEVMNAEEMSTFMISALKNFKSKNRRFPQQVIVYRDGIASTQIEHVDKHELQGIRQAFEKLQMKKTPKLQFILVNKRVNSRFVHKDTFQNVPKGLVVDDVVVSSQYWDFYLTPADAPEGCTSTPTRFIVIRDGLSLREKKGSLELEAFTKQLCNLYFNWPGPVRVPSCVKNADKLTTQFGSAVNGEVPHSLLQNSYHFL